MKRWSHTPKDSLPQTQEWQPAALQPHPHEDRPQHPAETQRPSQRPVSRRAWVVGGLAAVAVLVAGLPLLVLLVVIASGPRDSGPLTEERVVADETPPPSVQPPMPVDPDEHLERLAGVCRTLYQRGYRSAPEGDLRLNFTRAMYGVNHWTPPQGPRRLQIEWRTMPERSFLKAQADERLSEQFAAAVRTEWVATSGALPADASRLGETMLVTCTAVCRDAWDGKALPHLVVQHEVQRYAGLEQLHDRCEFTLAGDAGGYRLECTVQDVTEKELDGKWCRIVLQFQPQQ